MKIRELEVDEFDNFSKQDDAANPWQTSYFGKACATLGYNILYLGIEDNAALKGCVMLLTKEVYMGQSISYAPRGIITDYSNSTLLVQCLETLKSYLKEKQIMSITMDPFIIMSVRDNKGNDFNTSESKEKKLFTLLHGNDTIKENPEAKEIRKVIMNKCKFEYRGENLYFEGFLPRWYAMTRMPLNPKLLLSKIDKRSRNKLRKAAKLGIEIIKDDTKKFDNISDMVSQNEFGRPEEYYKEILLNNLDCELYLARINSEKYVNNSQVLYEREIENNEYLSKVIQNKTLQNKNIQAELNEKLQSDRSINSYKEQLVKATDTLKDYPGGKFIAYAIVIKSGKTLYIFEDGYDHNFKIIPALALLKWKILEQYSNDPNINYFNFGAITGNFDRKNNVDFGINLNRTSLNAASCELIGEFGIMTNKAMYNLYQAAVVNRHEFKI
jgi:lipid II:glycine glycyltransferase (peptidoglycan interpeptide bridge formation enzyme)